jgi:hypothetical protein
MKRRPKQSADVAAQRGAARQCASERVHWWSHRRRVAGKRQGFECRELVRDCLYNVFRSRLSSSSVHNDVTFASESAVPAGLQLHLCCLTTTEKITSFGCRTRQSPCLIVAAAAEFHVPLSPSSQPVPTFDFHHSCRLHPSSCCRCRCHRLHPHLPHTMI